MNYSGRLSMTTRTRCWVHPQGIHDPFIILDQMLRNLIRDLQRWAASRIGEVRAQLLMAREVVRRLDVAMEARQLTDAERSLRSRMKLQCLGLSSLERTMARQRARIRHIGEGDANTAYFHMLAQGRKQKNFILAVAIDGHITVDHVLTEQAFHTHFSGVFGTAPTSGFTLDFAELGVHAVQLGDLDLQISPDEVWAAIKAMLPDRAPGPDGFPGAFYRTAWGIIQPEVMRVVEAFCAASTSRLHKLNTAIIVLLPKSLGATSPSDFHPITIVHSFAKLVSKILALRLAPRMNEIVDKNQNAFIRTRSIHDNFKFVQRAAVLIRKRKKPMLLLKLDISKAFDTLSWPYLMEVMRARGFGDRWCT